MNIFERGLRRMDEMQQRHGPLAFVFGVMKKFGDDNAGVLVSSLAHSAFAAVFPLLLLLVTILGIVLADHPALRDQVLSSALSKFPVIGANLDKNISALHRDSLFGLAVGILGLFWGSLGLAQDGIFTMEEIWNLPGTDRPNYFKRLGRSVAFLIILAIGLLVSTFAAAAVPTIKGSITVAIAGGLVSGFVNVAQYVFAFRILTPAKIRSRQLLPGAAVAGAGWTVLQAMGGFVIGHYLKNDSNVYGTFAIVLGLLAWLYFVAELTVYAAEVNVVLARHLWPRSIVQPPLTEADQRSMAAQAEQNRRRPEQRISVSFDSRPETEGEFLAERGGR